MLKPARLTIGIAEPVSDGKFDVTKLIKDQRHSTPEHNRSIIRHTIRLANIQAVELPGLEFDEFLLFAIRSGLLSKWAGAFPDPRQEPEIGMEVRLATQLAAPVAGLYSMRQAGYVLRSAAVLGALGYSIEVREPEQGVSRRGTSDDKRISGDVGRKL